MATTIRHSETVAAPPSAVWPWYSEVSRWSRWDGGVSSVHLDGPFATGTRGRVTLPNGRRGRLRLLDVQDASTYTDTVRVPMLKVTTRHVLEPSAGGTRITHEVRLTGMLGRLFPSLTSIPVRKALPASVAQLAFLVVREPVALTRRVPGAASGMQRG